MPGLMDNRTLIHKLCVCSLMHHIIETTEHIKFIYMSSVAEFWNTSNLLVTMRILGSMLEAESARTDSLLVVYRVDG